MAGTLEVRSCATTLSNWVRENVASDRILNCRFAYWDKNYSKRKAAPTAGIPCKPKARLCVGGHMDPDIGKVEMQCDAPTATRTSLMLTLQKSLNGAAQRMCRSGTQPLLPPAKEGGSRFGALGSPSSDVVTCRQPTPGRREGH